MRPRRKHQLVGGLYAIAGLVTLAVAWQLAPFPDPTIWLLFAVVFVALNFQSVEINDRLFVSSSQMPLLTAGVLFGLNTIETSGPDGIAYSSALGMATVAALAIFDREDFRRRRVLQPMVNFGQLTVSAFCAGLAVDVIVATVGSELTVDQSVSGVVITAAVAGLAGAVVFGTLNLIFVRTAIVLSYGRSGLLPWSGMAIIEGSQMIMGLLGGLLAVVLARSDASVVPLILGVYVIGQIVYKSYADLRVAHESTLKGFVKTLEARDLYTRGHTERVAHFTRIIGERLGFTGTQHERMRWAALIHDMGKLAIPVEFMQKPGKLSDEEYRRLRVATHRVDDLLSEVDFLKRMVEIASGAHPRLPTEDFGQKGHRHSGDPDLEQKVLAVADAFDAMTHNRGYRMAMSQRAALEALRRDDAAIYDNDVIDALAQALETNGETYGPPELLEGSMPEVFSAR